MFLFPSVGRCSAYSLKGSLWCCMTMLESAFPSPQSKPVLYILSREISSSYSVFLWTSVEGNCCSQQPWIHGERRSFDWPSSFQDNMTISIHDFSLMVFLYCSICFFQAWIRSWVLLGSVKDTSSHLCCSYFPCFSTSTVCSGLLESSYLSTVGP